MSKPNIPAKEPVLLEMSEGTYWWCQCGLSTNQPYCDGSHKGTDFSPMKVEIEKERKVAWCQCKHTENGPFCDGSHNQL